MSGSIIATPTPLATLAASVSALLLANSTVALLNSPSFTGVPTGPTPTLSDSSTKLATTAFVQGNLGTAANKAASVVNGYATLAALAAAPTSGAFAVFSDAAGTIQSGTTLALPHNAGPSSPSGGGGVVLFSYGSGGGNDTLAYVTPYQTVILPGRGPGGNTAAQWFNNPMGFAQTNSANSASPTAWIQTQNTFNGGTSGYVVAPLWVNTYVGSSGTPLTNSQNFVWGILSQMDVYVSGGSAQHVGIQSAVNRHTVGGTGTLFAANFALNDQTGTASGSSASAVSVEIDHYANGLDSGTRADGATGNTSASSVGSNRQLLNLVYARSGQAGTAMEIANALVIGPQQGETQASTKNAISILGTNSWSALNMRDATLSNAGIIMAAASGHTIAWTPETVTWCAANGTVSQHWATIGASGTAGSPAVSIQLTPGTGGNVEIAGIFKMDSTILLPGLQASTSYANDAAAATGGVAVGQAYRNGSVQQVRIS